MKNTDFRILLYCVNTQTQRFIADLDYDFTGGKIQWQLSLATPVGYSRKMSVDTFKLVKADFNWFAPLFWQYGNCLKITVSVQNAAGANFGTYEIEAKTITMYNNYCTFNLIATGIEKDFADKAKSEITVYADTTIENEGGYTLRDLISKKSGRYYLANLFYTDNGSKIYSPNLDTSDGKNPNNGYLMRFTSYALANLVIDVTIELSGTYSRPDNNKTIDYVCASFAKVGFHDSKADIGLLQWVRMNGAIYIPQAKLTNTITLPTADGDYNILPRIVYTDGTWEWYVGSYGIVYYYGISLFFLGSNITYLPEIKGYSPQNVFGNIFGTENMRLSEMVRRTYFTNSDALNNAVPEPSMKIKVSDVITDVCKITGSYLSLRSGKYTFGDVERLVYEMDTLALSTTKDFSFSPFNDLLKNEVTVGTKTETYNNIENDRNVFNQKMTWRNPAYLGDVYDISLSKLRVDYQGVYDNVLSYSNEEKSNNNADVWAIFTNGNGRTTKPEGVSGVDVQTGWFNFEFSPKTHLLRFINFIRSLFYYHQSPDIIEAAVVENPVTNMSYSGVPELYPVTLADVQPMFTNTGVRFTALLTDAEFLSLIGDCKILTVQNKGETLSVLPVKIDISPLNRSETEIEGILLYNPNT